MEHKLTLQEVNNFYVSRLIDSLEKDARKWKREVHSGYDYSEIEYQSPKYTNERGDTITFTLSSFRKGAFVNGYYEWSVPLSVRFNIFSFQCRRFINAVAKMKNHLRKIQEENEIKKLMDAL
jgi:hypothetical protein